MRLVFLNSIGCLSKVETPPAISENVRLFLLVWSLYVESALISFIRTFSSFLGTLISLRHCGILTQAQGEVCKKFWFGSKKVKHVGKKYNIVANAFFSWVSFLKKILSKFWQVFGGTRAVLVRWWRALYIQDKKETIAAEVIRWSAIGPG